MMEKLVRTKLAAFGETDRNSDTGISSAAARRPWATPQVIRSTMQDTEGGAGAVPDGTPPPFSLS
jgi:hypothetical protein